MKTLGSYAALAAALVVMFVGAGKCDNSGTDAWPTYAAKTPIIKVHGLNFGPFIGGKNPNWGSTVSEEELTQLMGVIRPYTSWIRTFGCGAGLDKAGAIAHGMGLKAACGAWLSSDLAANDREVAALIALAKLGQADMLIVGSEVLQRNDLSEGQLMGYINAVRAAVPGAIVTTADTYGQLIAHPAVVAACDIVMANYYPWWESVSIENAISALDTAHWQMVAAAGGKEVYVSETGWPSGGATNGPAVPSPENASRYFHEFVAWASLHNVKYFYFEAFDELWKASYEGTHGAYWGIWDAELRMKPGMMASYPTNVSHVPVSGTITPGVQRTYTSVYSDADGYGNLADCMLLINSTLTSVNAAYVMYSRTTNKLYVINDAGTAWTGGVTPGSATTISNSYVTLHCQQTTVRGSGNDLTVNWSISIKPTMLGKVCGGWTYCRDAQGLTDGFDRFATYTVGNPPSNISLSPASAAIVTGVQRTYTSVHSDPDGYGNLADCVLLINSTLTSVNAPYVMYSRKTNRLFVINDAGTAWTGGVTPGTAATISNSYVTLHCQQTTVSGSGNNLTVNWSITMKPTMAGKTCGGWTYCRDDQGQTDGFDRFGTYTIGSPTPNRPPVNVSLIPTSATIAPNVQRTYTSVHSDPEGYGNLADCMLLINSTLTSVNAAYVMYSRSTNKLYVINDAGTAWTGGVTPGTAATVSNSYVTLHCQQTTVSGSGNNLTVNWSLTMKPTMAGKICGGWTYCRDAEGLADGFDRFATYTL